MNGFVSLILGLAILLQLLLSQAALAGDFTVDVSILLHGLRVHPGEKARLEGVLFVAGDPQTIKFTGTNLDPGIIVSFGNTSIDLPQKDHNELYIIVDGDSVAAGSHSVEVTATGGCTSTACTGPTHTVTVDLLVNVLIVRPPVYVPLPPRFHPK